jgi:hypothetical protein
VDVVKIFIYRRVEKKLPGNLGWVFGLVYKKSGVEIRVLGSFLNEKPLPKAAKSRVCQSPELYLRHELVRSNECTVGE